MEEIFDYWERQPTRSSCGPTSIKIACNILNKHQDKTPLEIFDYCSNQLKGSPWWRMFQMLDKLDINYSAHSDSFQTLLTNIKNHIVIISIEIEGLKHWCVLFNDNNKIVFFDPELGVFAMSEAYLKQLTIKRKFFHICVDTPSKNEYVIPTGFQMIDEHKMVLIGEANDFFNKKFNCIVTNQYIDKEVFAYNKEGLVIYV